MEGNIEKKEKKVEYLELIYDLIFVYVIGRNNSLLHHITKGFVEKELFIAYILCTLTVIQIWNFSTHYINMHGRNGLRDHIFLFINMYLLYFIGKGTQLDHSQFQRQYHVAWGLILINIGIQYLIELRNHRDEPEVRRLTRGMAFVLFGEALLVLLTLPVQRVTGIYLAPFAILFGIVGTMLHGGRSRVLLVDFKHLTERAMLYVVFTFGEMIIALAGYFEGGITTNTIYLSLMGFMIVVGLFLSYETVYDHLIDREMQTTGLTYMMLHILLIFALNIITTALEFMHNEAVDLLPKMLMLILAFLLYYVSLFGTLCYSRSKCRPNASLKLSLAAIAASFVALMLLFRKQMYVNIALTVVYVYGVFLILHRFSKSIKDSLRPIL